MEFRAPLLPKWLRWAIVVGLAAFIFYASILSIPPETVIDQVKPELLPLDKWRHFLAYTAFGYAIAYATTDRGTETRLLAAGVIGITVLYGVGIEFWQSQIPARHFSVADAYANALGGLLVVPYYLVRPHLTFTPIQD